MVRGAIAFVGLAVLLGGATPAARADDARVRVVIEGAGHSAGSSPTSAFGLHAKAASCETRPVAMSDGFALLEAVRGAGCVASYATSDTRIRCIDALCATQVTPRLHPAVGPVGRHWAMFVPPATGPISLDTYRARDGDVVVLAYREPVCQGEGGPVPEPCL